MGHLWLEFRPNPIRGFGDQVLPMNTMSGLPIQNSHSDAPDATTTIHTSFIDDYLNETQTYPLGGPRPSSTPNLACHTIDSE